MGDPLYKHSHLSFAEYQALEEAAEEGTRYEFIDGMVYAMSGGSLRHHRIIHNCAQALTNVYEPKGCQVLTETVQLEVAQNKRYVYPDVMVSCSERDWQSDRLIKDPILIIEVLSESTEKKDLVEKVEIYQAITSLKGYIIIDQSTCWLRIYERNEDGSWSAHRHLNSQEDTLFLRGFDWELPLSVIYRNMRFDQI